MATWTPFLEIEPHQTKRWFFRVFASQNPMFASPSFFHYIFMNRSGSTSKKCHFNLSGASLQIIVNDYRHHFFNCFEHQICQEALVFAEEKHDGAMHGSRFLSVGPVVHCVLRTQRVTNNEFSRVRLCGLEQKWYSHASSFARSSPNFLGIQRKSNVDMQRIRFPVLRVDSSGYIYGGFLGFFWWFGGTPYWRKPPYTTNDDAKRYN